MYCGQSTARRALEIAAAGGHNLLFVGPPGTGKSMLARRLPGILPPMSEAEALETAGIDSVLGVPIDLSHWRQRPFRAPHHTASAAALVGGGPVPRPGEISRAHNGVLFLDELPEFNRNVLEVLQGTARNGRDYDFAGALPGGLPGSVPARGGDEPLPVWLPRGFAAASATAAGIELQITAARSPDHCSTASTCMSRSGRPPTHVLRRSAERGEGSITVRDRVCVAQAVARRRSGTVNALLDGEQTATQCSEKGIGLLENAVDRFNLSVRAAHRVLRVSRTIADLARSTRISAPQHIAEALSFRTLERRKGLKAPSPMTTLRPCIRRQRRPPRPTNRRGRPWRACSRPTR